MIIAEIKMLLTTVAFLLKQLVAESKFSVLLLGKNKNNKKLS
jgi:hypothetical protein